MRASGRATTLEIAMLATTFEQVVRGRVKRAFRYSQIAWLAALVTGLGLVGIAWLEITALRVLAGVVAAAALAVMLAATSAYVFVRYGSRIARALGAGVAPEIGPAFSVVAERPSMAGASSATRKAIGGGGLALGLFSIAATWAVAEAIDLGRQERKLGPAPSVAVGPEQPEDIPPEDRADYKLRREGHVFVSGGVLHVPPSFRSDDGAFDLVMHFHGNTELIEQSVEAAKVNAIVYIVNLGIGSGAYEDRYSVPGLFDEAIDRIHTRLEKRGLEKPKLRRLALSCWSAGYGAISKIIESQKNLERIDSLIMLDGLHVGYLDEKNKTGPDPLRLQPFVRFAKEAAEGRKLFTLTHSEIEPREYASVRETSDILLRSVGADRKTLREAPPRVTLPASVGAMSKEAEKWLEQTSVARVGNFHVRGYVGQTPEHHMAHMIQMSVTVLPELAERWK